MKKKNTRCLSDSDNTNIVIVRTGWVQNCRPKIYWVKVSNVRESTSRRLQRRGKHFSDKTVFPLSGKLLNKTLLSTKTMVVASGM